VVFTGGPETASIKEWFSMLKEAVSCGARGATIGRNVWQSKNPAGMTRAISGIIHHGTSVEDALEEIGSN
jgi:DhnA family fructose-bisphosphate aldolase class Ia